MLMFPEGAGRSRSQQLRGGEQRRQLVHQRPGGAGGDPDRSRL